MVGDINEGISSGISEDFCLEAEKISTEFPDVWDSAKKVFLNEEYVFRFMVEVNKNSYFVKSPYEMVKTDEGKQEVLDYLGRIKNGVFF